MIRTLILASWLTAFLVTGCAGYYREYPRESRAESDAEAQYDEEYEYDDEPEMDVGMFAELRFYGRWYYVDAYGWCWRPFVVSAWRPYYHGHWVWSDYGWMWVSYEPFGWATYHYGYWDYNFALGWLWIPDYDWSPCRVSWVVYDDYVCWAPLPPPGVRLAQPWSSGRINVWVVVHADRFTDDNVGRYRVRPKFKSRYAAPAASHEAPEKRVVERFKGKEVRTVSVDLERTKAGKREFARVKLPPEQARIVQQHQARVESRVLSKSKVQVRSKGKVERSKKLKAQQKSKKSKEEGG